MHENFWEKLTNKCHLFWELYHEVGSFVTPWPRCGQTRLDRRPLNSALLADELHGKRKAVVALCTRYCTPLKFFKQSVGNLAMIFTCYWNSMNTTVNFHERWYSLDFHYVQILNLFPFFGKISSLHGRNRRSFLNWARNCSKRYHIEKLLLLKIESAKLGQFFTSKLD